MTKYKTKKTKVMEAYIAKIPYRVVSIVISKGYNFTVYAEVIDTAPGGLFQSRVKSLGPHKYKILTEARKCVKAMKLNLEPYLKNEIRNTY